MKLIPTSFPDLPPLLAFGAHPDDLEFGCGGVIARETSLGRRVHFCLCSEGEAGSRGTPEVRQVEAQKGASLLGATLEYVELDGDAHLEIKAVHALKIAGIIRRTKPGIVFAPSLSENQHPDHFRLGRLISDAARLARYGGLSDLKQLAPHSIDQLLYYALTLESEPTDISPLLINVSSPEVLAAWTAAMEAHESQVTGRNYLEIQLARARLRGLSAGVTHAIAVYPADPPVFDSLVPLSRGARQF